MILYFDTETTGLRPGNICQLSYVMEDAFGVMAKNFFFTVDMVEYSAYLVHGFSVEDLFNLSGGKRFVEHIKEIAFDFALADLIVAHNISFDLNFLRAEFDNVGECFRYKNDFCSMKSAVPICKLPRKTGAGYKYPKLTELCQFLHIIEDEIVDKERLLYGSITSSHDARFDTTALYLCAKKASEIYPEFSCVKEFI